MYPAAEGHDLIEVGGCHLAAVVSTHVVFRTVRLLSRGPSPGRGMHESVVAGCGAAAGRGRSGFSAGCFRRHAGMLEIRFVPASALEVETCGRNLLDIGFRLACGAGGERGITHLLQMLPARAALSALIFVDRHGRP